MEQNHCSYTEKIKMIEMNARGSSINDICDEIGRDQRTVRRWVNRWENENTVDTRHRSGRTPEISHEHQAKLIAYMLKNPTSTIRQTKLALGFTCSTRTIDDYLKRNKLRTFIAPKKPAHFPVHLRARFSFARIMKNWHRWSDVIFSDESSFANHRSCARKVWRRRGTEAPMRTSSFNATRYIRINVWGAIQSNGFVALRLVSNNFDSEEYLEVISTVLPAFFQLNPYCIWMHDNAPIHKTQEIREFFEENGIQKIMWPARSPDLNPIENIWAHITQKLDQLLDKKGEATSAAELWRRVRYCASRIPRTEFVNLYQSIQKRLKSVYNKEGHYTKY